MVLSVQLLRRAMLPAAPQEVRWISHRKKPAIKPTSPPGCPPASIARWVHRTLAVRSASLNFVVCEQNSPNCALEIPRWVNAIAAHRALTFDNYCRVRWRIVDEEREAFPSRQGITDRHGQFALLADQRQLCPKPGPEIVDLLFCWRTMRRSSALRPRMSFSTAIVRQSAEALRLLLVTAPVLPVHRSRAGRATSRMQAGRRCAWRTAPWPDQSGANRTALPQACWRTDIPLCHQTKPL